MRRLTVSPLPCVSRPYLLQLTYRATTGLHTHITCLDMTSRYPYRRYSLSASLHAPSSSQPIPCSCMHMNSTRSHLSIHPITAAIDSAPCALYVTTRMSAASVFPIVGMLSCIGSRWLLSISQHSTRVRLSDSCPPPRRIPALLVRVPLMCCACVRARSAQCLCTCCCVPALCPMRTCHFPKPIVLWHHAHSAVSARSRTQRAWLSHFLRRRGFVPCRRRPFCLPVRLGQSLSVSSSSLTLASEWRQSSSSGLPLLAVSLSLSPSHEWHRHLLASRRPLSCVCRSSTFRWGGWETGGSQGGSGPRSLPL